MLSKIREVMFKVLKPITQAIGSFHLPGTKRKMTQKDVYKVLNVVRVGDVLLSRKDWELSNLFIQGRFKHAAICISGGRLIEAVDPVVREIGFFDFVMKADKVIICRPLGFEQFELDDAKVFAKKNIGNKYDYYFIDGNEDNYCSELVYEALKAGKPDWGFVRRLVMGKATVLPDDFRLAEKYFKKVLELEGK